MECNNVNLICCVATVCHQVRCVYWGHLGHFHRTISHLKWYKIVCMTYLACIFISFPCFSNLEFPDIFFGYLLRFEYITSRFSCLCMSMLTSNSSGNMQKHGYLRCFHAAYAASARENISWVWVITYHNFNGCETKQLWPLLLTWFNFNPSMDK